MDQRFRVPWSRLSFKRGSAPLAAQTGVRSNAAWNALQQISALAGGTAFSLVLAGFLPIEEYGRFSYALAMCSVGTALTSAGLQGLGVRYVLDDEANAGRTLVSLLVVREAFAAASYVCLTLVAYASSDEQTVLLTGFMLLVLFARAADTPELYFLAKMKVRVTALCRIAVAAVFMLLRVWALFASATAFTFACLLLLEVLAGTVAIYVAYFRSCKLSGRRSPSMSQMRGLFGNSVPMVVSTIANQINLKVDVVAISSILGPAAVGTYSIAARVGELAFFLPVAIMNSTLPVLVAARRHSYIEYETLLTGSYRRAFLWGFALSSTTSGVCVLSRPWLQGTLEEATLVLSVYIWTCPIVFMGAVLSKWIVLEGALWSSAFRHLLGAGVNILMCILLIPKVGLLGAAIATLAGYVVANLIAVALISRSRGQSVLMMRAMAVWKPLPQPKEN